MRAIRAILPKWRSDQKRQQEWQDALENKIEAIAKNIPKPKPVAPKPKAAPKPKPAPKPAAAAAGGDAKPGDLFAELLAKRKRL